MYLMTNRISSQQDYVLTFVANNPGCSVADVCRAEWGGRGHYASYERVKRLLRRGFLEDRSSSNTKELYVTDTAPCARNDDKVF